jgi:hypothetical protein
MPERAAACTSPYTATALSVVSTRCGSRSAELKRFNYLFTPGSWQGIMVGDNVRGGDVNCRGWSDNFAAILPRPVAHPEYVAVLAPRLRRKLLTVFDGS